MSTQDKLAEALRELSRNIEKEHIFSDAMDSAVNAFVCTRHGIIKNAEKSGEESDGEKVMRRSLQAALLAYIEQPDNQIAVVLQAHAAEAAQAQAQCVPGELAEPVEGVLNYEQERSFAEGWNACRNAMLAAAPQAQDTKE